MRSFAVPFILAILVVILTVVGWVAVSMAAVVTAARVMVQEGDAQEEAG